MLKKGDIVYHKRSGGRGEIRTLQNRWDSDVPTIVAVIRVNDTMFPRISCIPIDDLLLCRRKKERRK